MKILIGLVLLRFLLNICFLSFRSIICVRRNSEHQGVGVAVGVGVTASVFACSGVAVAPSG